MKMKVMPLVLVGALCALAACDQQEKEAKAPEQITPAQVVHVSEWLGRWDGPEGTYLDIAEREIGYELTIANLEGPRKFDGTGKEDSIVFTRDGEVLNIHAGTGEDTGMKWLAHKKYCLIVKTGEGYCRN